MPLSMRRQFLVEMVLAGGMVGFVGCGVKGDPEPPLEPPRLGRGRASLHETPLPRPQKPEEESANPAEKNR